MRTATRNAIERHAIEDYPREACGLILAVEGKEVYHPCRNVAADNSDFRMPAEDYAAAEDRGQVVAVVHSHIDRSPQPTEADRVGCEETGLPWHIVSVRQNAGDPMPTAGEWFTFEPCGYESPLVGRTFHHGTLDCFGLVRDFYRVELGIELPDIERPDNWWKDPDGGELYLDNYRCWGFREVDKPEYGDVILMQYRSERTNHAGIYLGDKPLKSQPELHTIPNAMLHHALPHLSDRVVYGGYWSDITRMIVRYQGER